MRVERFDSGLLDSSMYVVSENGHALVIDPCPDTSAADRYTVDALIVSHEHFDHIFGVNAWKERCGAPLLCSGACAARISDPRTNQARHFDSFCELQSFSERWDASMLDPTYSCRADRSFSDELSLQWQGHRVLLREIPGHSPGSIGIWVDDLFFSGDSLLEGREIELRFPSGSRKQWEERGKKIIDAVPDGTMVYPGHHGAFILKR